MAYAKRWHDVVGCTLLQALLAAADNRLLEVEAAVRSGRDMERQKQVCNIYGIYLASSFVFQLLQ